MSTEDSFQDDVGEKINGGIGLTNDEAWWTGGLTGIQTCLVQSPIYLCIFDYGTSPLLWSLSPLVHSLRQVGTRLVSLLGILLQRMLNMSHLLFSNLRSCSLEGTWHWFFVAFFGFLQVDWAWALRPTARQIGCTVQYGYLYCTVKDKYCNILVFLLLAISAELVLP